MLEPKKIKYVSFHFFPFFFFFGHEVLGPDAMIFVVLNVDKVDVDSSYSHISSLRK